MERRGRYPAEVRERGVRLVFEEQQSHELAVGGDHVDRREVGLHGGNASALGATSRARLRQAPWTDKLGA